MKKKFDIFKPELIIEYTNGINVPPEDVQYFYPNSRIRRLADKYLIDVYPRIINLKQNVQTISKN